MSTKLSVNLNKVALIRNARGANLPDLRQVAIDCERFGAQGITLHPRPDERHARYDDIYVMKEVVTTELNVEGYPNERFLNMIEEIKPTQCTLVPDPPGILTSDSGWDTVDRQLELKDIVSRIHSQGVRVSLFMDPEEAMIEGAQATGADRIEFYTGKYAQFYNDDREMSVEPFRKCGILAKQLGLGVNAGHDLNLDNLKYFVSQVSDVLEVSIGHALIADALYYGLQNTIGMYRAQLM